MNAILPIESRIEYIETKLAENGVRPKLIPPDEALKEHSRKLYRDKHAQWVDDAIAELLSLDDLKKELADRFEKDIKLEENARAYIEEAFAEDDSLSWRSALTKRLEEVLRQEKSEELAKAVKAKVIEALDKKKEN